MFFFFSMAHACATFAVAMLGFGFSEAGSILAIPLGIIAFVLAPFWILGEWLTVILPDTAAMIIGIFANSIMWWCGLVVVYSIVTKRKNGKRERPAATSNVTHRVKTRA